MKSNFNNIDIENLQLFWKSIFGTYDLEKSMLWMTEEFGEVISSIRKGHNKELIAGEIGDLSTWIISLCNILDIDFEKALESTLNKEIKRQLLKYGKLKYMTEDYEEVAAKVMKGINEND